MAKQMTDIFLADDDLTVTAGDLATGECTAQHQELLILNNKGDFKENPTICVGAVSYFDDERYQGLIRAISIEFTRDGMEVDGVSLTANGTVKSRAVYQ